MTNQAQTPKQSTADSDMIAVAQGRMAPDEFNRKHGGPLTAAYVKRQNYRRLANIHLSRIIPNPGGDPLIEKSNDRQLKLARFCIRQAGGQL